MSIPTRYVSLQDAAAHIAVSPRTIRRMIAEGRLTGYKAGNRLVRVDINELDQALRPIPTVRMAG